MKINDVESPQGTYAGLWPDDKTKQKIASVLELLHLPNPISVDKIHVTIVYSRKPCPTIKHIDVKMPMVADGIAFGILGSSLVVHLNSPEMSALHELCRKEHGATHDYLDFKPHITLSYEYTLDELPDESFLVYLKNLSFDKYEVEPLELDWNDPA